MTRSGVDALKQQLWAKAMRRGPGRANEVLIVADGTVWIWNLARDRFPGARQRVDFYHVSQHLWSVAQALYPDELAVARAWGEPMLDKLRADASCEAITELEPLRARGEARPARPSSEKRATCGRIATDWTTGRPARKVNRWAANRWNPPAENTRCASNDPANSEASPATKR